MREQKEAIVNGLDPELRTFFQEKVKPGMEREIVLLGLFFFQSKYDRRKIANNLYKEIPPDFSHPLAPAKWFFQNAREANSEIEGGIEEFVSETIINNPRRLEFFPLLSDSQIKGYVSAFNKIFENQEYCARCECWSYYDTPPEEFAKETCADMIRLLSFVTEYSYGRDRLLFQLVMAEWEEMNYQEAQTKIQVILEDLKRQNITHLLLPTSKNQEKPAICVFERVKRKLKVN